MLRRIMSPNERKMQLIRFTRLLCDRNVSIENYETCTRVKKTKDEVMTEVYGDAQVIRYVRRVVEDIDGIV